MSTAAPPLTLTFEDWYALDEDEPGELVDGRLEQEEVTDATHDTAALWLAGVLRAWLQGRQGFVFGPDVKFVVGPDRGRKPDLAVFLPGGRVPPRRGLIRVPPDIVVEVVSPRPRDGRRDRVEKLAEYAAFGVRYYWLVDPQLRSLEVLELRSDARYLHVLAASEGTVETVPGCEGLRLELDALWAELDRLGAEEPEATEI